MSDTTGRKLFKHSGTALLFRGTLAIALGLLVASLPVATVFGLVYVFGIYAITDGLANLAHYFYDPARHSRWSMAGGFISVAAGLVAVSWPGITATALSLLIGIWALALGISQIMQALEARAETAAWGIRLLTGLAMAALGFMLVLNPGAGIVSLAWLLATFTVVEGLLLIVSGVKFRRRATSTMMLAR
ncbi:HdeD family acid-resistance protein [Arthrobacter sp. CJ23]|uniref:HdeD family acid-resistance protein n=1 Tax=Arthrobacter sp. CJ23 TaxID=2972479 RepID=UPI00215C5F42|nr:HdeD family acid-resistance protein [Arthrobacter sp. CJ23]UVJ39978.1 HdeD family acid-resistance protein [Arthrobacter sp. CJ23]